MHGTGKWIAGALLMLGTGAMAMAPTATASRVVESIDEDMALVQRAVADRPQRQSATPTVARDERRQRPTRRDEPQWLKVRIREKGEGEDRLSINLPLAVLRAASGDRALPGCDDKHKLRLGDILKRLESGPDIVLIEDGETQIRVWVE